MAWACGDGTDPVTPRDPADLRTELVVESPPPGFEGAVTVDSASWFPAAQLPTGDGLEVEIEGPYRIEFRNTASQPLDLRFDLRFLDEDGFFVGNFIPFGLPLRLDADQVGVHEGVFLVRTTAGVGRFGLATMSIVARVTAVE